jgi:hemolysin III
VSLVGQQAPAGPADDSAANGAVRPLLRGWLHAGALAVALVAGPVLAAHGQDPEQVFVLSLYALALVSLFGVSASFHRIRWGPVGRRRMRRADHATIFFAIAGSYSAVAGLVLHGWARMLVLCLVWVGGAIGVTVRQVWMDVPKYVVAIPYVIVGWCALAVMPQLLRGIGGAGFALIVAGGACYTCGALCYALRRPDPAPGVFGYHEIFHTFTIIGAALHFVAIAGYALPRA